MTLANTDVALDAALDVVNKGETMGSPPCFLDQVIILGIDPGTRISGYSVLIASPGRPSQLVDYGVVRANEKMLLSEKYHYLFESVQYLIKKYQVTQVAVESQYVDKNPQSAIKLGMAKGAVLIAACSNSLPVFEYAPCKVKEAVTGNGSSTKEQLAQMLSRYFPKVASYKGPLDATDALAIAFCHANQLAFNLQRSSSHRI